MKLLYLNRLRVIAFDPLLLAQKSLVWIQSDSTVKKQRDMDADAQVLFSFLYSPEVKYR